MKMKLLWVALLLALFTIACDDKKKTDETPKTPVAKTGGDTKKTPEATKKPEETKTAEATEDDEDDLEFTDNEVEEIAATAAGEVNEANADAIIAALEKELDKELSQ